MMHREADYLIGYAGGDGEILGRSGGETAICAEVADERVEVAATKNVGIFHLEI